MTGAVEYLHGKKRWCLWLEGITPAELNEMPLVKERVSQCKTTRETSKAEGIRKFAKSSMLFAQRTQPVGKPMLSYQGCLLKEEAISPWDSWMAMRL